MTEKCDICGKFVARKEYDYGNQEWYEGQKDFYHIACLEKESEQQND